MRPSLIGLLLALPLAIGMGAGEIGSPASPRKAHRALSDTERDVIAISSSSDYFHREKTEEQGTWQINEDSIGLDAFGAGYAMDGANLLTKKGDALGAFEFTVNIKVNDIKSGVENPMIGFIPWYFDDDNYMFVQLKFSSASQFQTTADERSEGYGLEQLIFSGKYKGEAKYKTQTGQEENTVINAGGSAPSSELLSAKRSLKNADGHTLKIRFENDSATALSYHTTITYNDVQITKTYAWYYTAMPENVAVGFMAQDVKCTFSDAILDDFYATNNSAVLARDWRQANGFTYRTLNGVDSWTFGEGDAVDFVTDAVKNGTKKISEYTVSGSNIAGYDTNRGYTPNPLKEDSSGLPQNYEVKASFSLSEIPEYAGKTLTQGYGLLAWYMNDINFVDVMIRRTVSGLKASPTIKGEIVLFGWLDASSSKIGTNVYTLPSSFDFTAAHTLRVEKKSTGFYVFLDDGSSPVLQKIVKGTEVNYFYGYEGYNAKFHATKIESKAIYEAYDEIAVLDDAGNAWRAAGASKSAWTFADGGVAISARGESHKRSYIIGTSDVSDINMSVILEGTATVGNGYAELMLAPYMVDENNYARIGLVFDGGHVYARIRTATYTDADMDDLRDPQVNLKQTELQGVSLNGSFILKAELIRTTLALYLNGELIYGRVISDIDQVSDDYGLYLTNIDLNATSFRTEGYKKYTEYQVGDYRTSAMKYNAWTIDEEGRLAGDATYTPEMRKDEFDGERTFAIKENTLRDNYELHCDIIATAQSEAEDRVGVVMWYLDNENFMIFYIDSWRMDSTVPRTTIYGKLDGKTLPVTFNHGGWFPEGEHEVEPGITQTEASQVTHLHHICVTKQGNNFTCYVDKPGQGYISYTVAAGLPSDTGKTVYSGLYTYNDAILVHTYDVTEIGAYDAANAHTPCEAGHPYDQTMEAPELPTYTESIYQEPIDAVIDNVGGADVDPGTSSEPVPPTTSEVPPVISSEPLPPTSEGGEGEKKGCGGSIAATSSLIGVLAFAGAGVLIAKKRKNRE